jgi:hypothetical protein
MKTTTYRIESESGFIGRENGKWAYTTMSSRSHFFTDKREAERVLQQAGELGRLGGFKIVRHG